MHKHTYKNSRECVEQADRPVPPPPPLTYSWQQNSPVYATYVQTLTEWDFQEKSIHSEVHPPTLVSYLHKQTQKTGSVWHKKLEHLSLPGHLFHTFVYSPHPSVSRRKQKRRQNNLLSGQFQTIRRVLWPSSSSPASSRANPRTPLWSSPGLSVGAAMHTVSIKQSQSHHSLLYSFQTNKSCCLQGEDQVTSENTLMHREI